MSIPPSLIDSIVPRPRIVGTSSKSQRVAQSATMAMMVTAKILITTIALLGLSAAADARNALPRRNLNLSDGVVAAWEHIEGRRCAYLRIAGGRWYSTRIVAAHEGFATLQALGRSARQKVPIAFTVLPPISECGPLPGMKIWVATSPPSRRR